MTWLGAKGLAPEGRVDQASGVGGELIAEGPSLGPGPVVEAQEGVQNHVVLGERVELVLRVRVAQGEVEHVAEAHGGPKRRDARLL
eukprot:CAMPEP_0172627964 /NCGR_PEP_ID=MMETSP1068-20121228/159132_1 /TAXON_ID=35684 /ORGANISM="Pseudopedinella elastica, Strain CCMP716" /LENGTH=85 /DNA_ID=CAMNT_0013438003 /DNA_START=51 /DNA_END=309 /DNA_ORIENTATION=+